MDPDPHDVMYGISMSWNEDPSFRMTRYDDGVVLLIVCYAIAVLSINAAVVLLNTCASVYTRACYALGHLYIGHGQHSLLRIALGVIETLSGSFRSVSLSLRIVCNAVAGHVLLAVLVEMSVTAYHYVP